MFINGHSSTGRGGTAYICKRFDEKYPSESAERGPAEGAAVQAKHLALKRCHNAAKNKKAAVNAS